MMRKIIQALTLLSLLTMSCQLSISLDASQESMAHAAGGAQEEIVMAQALPAATSTPIPQPTPTETLPPPAPEEEDEDPPALPPGPFGPDVFPPGINPLSGLPVSNPENLALSPALVSITNFPVTARPQAGLDFSPFVFEMYVGEGMSRFLALFYGEYPAEALAQSEGPPQAAPVPVEDAQIGPVRSGRLPYESLRKAFNGFLVMSSAYNTVSQNLSEYVNVFGSDSDDINSAGVRVGQLKAIAQANSKDLGVPAMSGLKFDIQPPQGGKPAHSFWLMWSYLNQVFWRYDPASGAYLRYQDNADGKTYSLATDRLNGKPLTYENVIILFANHRVYADTLIDLDLLYINKGKALLLRDGQLHEIYWTTKNEEYEKTTGRLRPIRYLDTQGNPAALKPGQTWVMIVPVGARYWETIDSENYLYLLNNEKPGSGYWAMRFYRPPVEKQ